MSYNILLQSWSKYEDLAVAINELDHREIGMFLEDYQIILARAQDFNKRWKDAICNLGQCQTTEGDDSQPCIVNLGSIRNHELQIQYDHYFKDTLTNFRFIY